MEVSVTVENKTGLHARPASMFIKEARNYTSDISIIKDEQQVDAKNILGVLSLGITKGTTILLKAEGEDEEKAIGALKSLIESKFGEN